MKELRDRRVAITGAAGGLGRALALEVAERGAPVALADLDEAGLDGTRRACEAFGVDARVRRVDVARVDEVQSWADEVAAAPGGVHVVMNNAGVTLVATTRNLGLDEFEWVMAINFWGVVHGTQAFLPHLEAGGGGHVVNVSSAFGLIGNPGQPAYTASKFAVRGFTEALAMELHVEGSPVRAHVVHPGGVATDIARHARFGEAQAMDRAPAEMHAEFDRMARTSAADAARQIVDGVCRGDPRIVVGADARAISLLQRLLPRRYQTLVRAGAKRRGLGQV